MNFFLLQGFVTFFGVGKLPKMPGTWGTLAGIPLLLVFWKFSVWQRLCFVILATFATVYLVSIYEQKSKTHDSSEVVVDEILGLLFSGILLEYSTANLISCFLIFRFFDIFKPFPINTIDQKCPGGWGTVLDDVMAGILACIVIQLSILILG